MDIFDQESLQALGATLYQNERPLQGVAGLIDWHFPKILSDFIRNGSMSGRDGELVCVPVVYRERPIRILLLGNGSNSRPGDRPKVSDSSIKTLAEGALKLRIETLALSAADFGLKTKKDLESAFKGINIVWVGE